MAIQHSELSRFSGQWTSIENNGETMARFTCRLDLDGSFVIENYIQEKDNKITMRGLGIFGFDVEKQRYTHFWFDSRGSFPIAPTYGDFSNNAFIFISDDTKSKTRYTYQFLSSNKLEFIIETALPASDWQTIFYSVATRT